MKKALIYLTLLVGITSIIGACKKEDDSSSTSTLSAPTGVTATAGASQVSISWTVPYGASSHIVYWDNATGVSSSSTAITVNCCSNSYTHTGLDNDTTYYYKVAAVNSDGTLMYSFVQSLEASYPFYFMRFVGGVFIVAGMVIMLYNVLKTVSAKNDSLEAEVHPA